MLPAKSFTALQPRIILDDDWCGPENFIKPLNVAPIVVPEDGPAESRFREMVYRLFDKKRYDIIVTGEKKY